MSKNEVDQRKIDREETLRSCLEDYPYLRFELPDREPTSEEIEEEAPF